MNILPQKSWHVRTKRNIERVRRDEEKAAEEEKEKQRRIALAEQEARTEFLRDKAKAKRHKEIEPELGKPSIEYETSLQASSSSTTDLYTASGHINFFKEAESGELKSGKNAEHEAEKKAEKEKWEKDIGLLTYLGQSSVESQASLPWYLAPKKKREEDAVEKAWIKDKKLKDKLDPMREMETYVKKTKHKHNKKDKDKDKHKHIKHKHKSKDKERKEENKQHSSQTKTIEQLRAERLKREQEEKRRTSELLSRGKSAEATSEPERQVSDRDRRYNSQYNPDFVKRPRHRHDYEL